MNIESYISPFIESQFPAFYREEGPDFILFLKTYYEWLESTGKTLSYTRKLPDYHDIDKTIDEFLIHFQQKYLLDLPYAPSSDKRLLIKHIQDLYRSKGTERGVQLLLRLLYNVDSELYYPGEDIFKLSDSKWTIPRYIEVTPLADNNRFLSQVIKGTTSGATAYVERIVNKRVAGKYVSVFYLSAITGMFEYEERVVLNTSPIVEGAPQVVGSLSSLIVTNGGQEFFVGDILNVTTGSGRQAKALVTDVSTETGRVTFRIVDGGFGYSTNAQVIISTKNIGVANLTNANSEITSFERFETISQPLATLVYTSASNSALFANGSVVENYYGNGSVSANALILVNTITNTTSGTLILRPGTGNVASDSTFSRRGNTVTGVISSYTNTTATANVMYVSNTSLGLYNITNVFVPYPNNYIVGASSNTYANVTAVSTGTAANFAVGSLTNTETVYVTPDLLRANNSGNVPFLSITLDGSNSNVAANGYGFVKYPGGTIDNTSIQNLLRQNAKTIGEIYVLTSINPGEGYNADPYVVVLEPEIISLEKHDVTLKISNLTGLFIPNELVEMSSTIAGQQLTVSNFTGTAANGAINSTAEIGEYVYQSNGTSNTATGFVYQVNIAGGSGNIKLSNTTGTFVNTYTINTLTSNATANVSAANSVSLTTTTTGSIKSSNTTILKVKRLNLYNEFYSGYSLLGKVSGATATIVDAAEDYTTLQLGENAIISSNVQVANTVASSLQVVDSGFGYVNGETVSLSKDGNPYVATARVVLMNQGSSEGYFDTRSGFLSSVDKIHDGEYYQDYSYEIKSRVPLQKYASVLKSIVHTAGTTFFGKVIIDSAPDFNGSNIIATASRVVDLNIKSGNGSFTVGERIAQGSANGNVGSVKGVIIIANNAPYIEQYTQISTPSFSSNTSSANVIATSSNSSHTTIYTNVIEGTIDTTDNIEAVIGRTITINSVGQGNTVTGSFAVGERVYQANTLGGVNTANGTVFVANSTQIQIRVVAGSWLANTTIYGATSNAYANASSVVNATATYATTSSINTLRVSNTTSSFTTSQIVVGANSGATGNVSYVSITLDT